MRLSALPLCATAVLYDPETYDFGANWQSYVKGLASHNEEWAIAYGVSRVQLLNFLSPKGLDLDGPFGAVADEQVLKGLTFLDIGSGSGLHSVVAAVAGARVISLDRQEGSASSTDQLRQGFGSILEDSDRWQVYLGDVLLRADVEGLQADVVYSWGVLHHTGEMWKAIENACSAMKPVSSGGGVLFIALYSREVVSDPEYWKRIKRLYLDGDELSRAIMEREYAWWLLKDEVLRHRRNPFAMIQDAQLQRGMDFWTDVRDWLGGYPIEFSETVDVIRFVRERCGLVPARVDPSTVTEYLFVPEPETDAGSGLVAQWQHHILQVQSELLVLKGYFQPLNLVDSQRRDKCFAAELPIAGDTLSSLRFDVYEDGLLYGMGVETGIRAAGGVRTLDDLATAFQLEDLELQERSREWQARFGTDGYTCDRPGRYLREVFWMHGIPLVVFSSSDGSDPNTNGRIYGIRPQMGTGQTVEPDHGVKVATAADLEFTRH